MAYSDFTLEQIVTQFDFKTDNSNDYFAATKPASISDLLRQTLEKRTARALFIATEKARAEMLTAPILL